MNCRIGLLLLFLLSPLRIAEAGERLHALKGLTAMPMKEDEAEFLARVAIKTECDDPESPLALVSGLLHPESDCHQVAKNDDVQQKLAEFTHDLVLEKAGEDGFLPEEDCDLAQNWIFSFQLRKLSDHVFFAIVPKNRQGRIKITGFN